MKSSMHGKMILCGIKFINLFKDYFGVSYFNESNNLCQNRVTYITHHTEKGTKVWDTFIKKQNNLSRKGPLEAIYSNLQFRAGVIKPGCSGTLVKS